MYEVVCDDTAAEIVNARVKLAEHFQHPGLQCRVLLEADVNYKVARGFIKKVEERAMGAAGVDPERKRALRVLGGEADDLPKKPKQKKRKRTKEVAADTSNQQDSDNSAIQDLISSMAGY